MKQELLDNAKSAGWAWANLRADEFASRSAYEWPETWDPSWTGELPFLAGEIDDDDAASLRAAASQVAAKAWRELVDDRRDDEDIEDDH
jgi:hypothetical protein